MTGARRAQRVDLDVEVTLRTEGLDERAPGVDAGVGVSAASGV
jgi:hypothetical protein